MTSFCFQRITRRLGGGDEAYYAYVEEANDDANKVSQGKRNGMILLMGGTSETSLIAVNLACAGLRVLVSCATQIDLDTGSHPNITLRRGPLNTDGLVSLIKAREIALIVDAAHPYATGAHAAAREAARFAGVTYLAYIRPADAACEEAGIIYVVDHNEAAKRAFAEKKPVLLTTGSRNLAPYAGEAKRNSVPLIVRVLPETSSMAACQAAGIPEESIIAARGPFSLEENRDAIRRFTVGVLVTKDSGVPGGVREKIEAARLEGCKVVVVKRPVTSSGPSFSDISLLQKHIISIYPA